MHSVRRTAPEQQTEQSRRKELKAIGEYKSLVETVQTNISQHVYTKETLDLTSKLLTQNPEYYTIWNYRRRVYLHGLLQEDPLSTSGPDIGASAKISTLIEADLKFLVPLLKQFPKCYWIWNHRLWLLQQCTLRLDNVMARRVWETELLLIGKMLTLDSRNFHGWGYRRIVVKNIEDLDLQRQRPDKESEEPVSESRGGGEKNATNPVSSLTRQEFDYTTRMINVNLSNFSAWHSRSLLLPKLLYEDNADSATRRKAWDAEIELIHTAMYTDPYDSSIWAYQSTLMDILDSREKRRCILVDPSLEERYNIIKGELEVVEDLLEDTKDCKWIYEAYVRLALRRNELEKLQHSDAQARIEIKAELNKLCELDPLRSGRWREQAQQLGTTIT